MGSEAYMFTNLNQFLLDSLSIDISSRGVESEWLNSLQSYV